MSAPQPSAYEGDSLEGALPALLFAWGEVDARASALGIQIRRANYGGLRDEAFTRKILRYRENDWAQYVRENPVDSAKTTIGAWRRIRPYGTSAHNYGAAFDVEIVTTPARMSKLAALNIVKDLCLEAGLIDGRAFDDPPHAELPGGLVAWKAAWLAEGHTDGAYNGFADPDALAAVAIVVLLVGAFFLLRS